MAKTKFGEPIGVAPGQVVAYSSHYRSADVKTYWHPSSWESYHEGIYTGYKYQCVEFARRWLVQVAGITFDDVHMAYHIFELPHFLRVSSFSPTKKMVLLPEPAVIKVHKHRNGAKVRPVVGSVLLWEAGGYFKHTGHVAIVVDVTDSFVRVAEQNVTDSAWGDGRNYARELPVRCGGDGEYHIEERHTSSNVLGWVTVEEFVENCPVPHSSTL